MNIKIIACSITYCKHNFIPDVFLRDLLQKTGLRRLIMFATKHYPDQPCYNNHTTTTGLRREIFATSIPSEPYENFSHGNQS